MYGPGIATRFIIEFTAAGSGTWALGNSGCFTPVHLCPPNRILIRGAAYSITCPTASYEHLRPVGLGMSAGLAPISAVAGGQLCRHVREYPAEHAQRACLSHRRELLAPGSLRIVLASQRSDRPRQVWSSPTAALWCRTRAIGRVVAWAHGSAHGSGGRRLLPSLPA